MDEKSDLQLSQEILRSESPEVSSRYTFYVLIVPDEGQVIVERVGTLVVVTRGAWKGTKELVNMKYPGSTFEFKLPKNLQRQAERILAKARSKRQWQKQFLSNPVETLYSPPIGLSPQMLNECVAELDSNFNQKPESAKTSDTTQKTEP